MEEPLLSASMIVGGREHLVRSSPEATSPWMLLGTSSTRHLKRHALKSCKACEGSMLQTLNLRG